MAKPGPDPISKDECRDALRLATERLGHPPTFRKHRSRGQRNPPYRLVGRRL